MFESVGRMFRSNKANILSPKRSKFKEGSGDCLDNCHEMKIDDSSILLKRLKELHSEQLMTDVILVLDGKEYSAHRLILCALSDVFQIMLMKPEWSEWHESRIILQECQQCTLVFHSFIEYFYTGQITLTYSNVLPILTLADKYNVKNLISTCVLYMCSNIAHAAANNELISWLHYTLACNHIEVSKKCENYVHWNIESISNNEDYGHFDNVMFMALLQQNNLIVENEITLYHCAVKWLNHQFEHLKQEGCTDLEIADQMKALTVQVMVHIRFPMMTPRQLADLLLSPLINKYKEFFVERMAIGMIYHSGHEDRIHDLYNNVHERLLFTPRLYTSDVYSSVLLVDNFSALPIYETCTYTFSTNLSLAEYKGDCRCDWTCELYPKGVWFRKCLLKVWQGTIDVPEFVIPKVRLSVTCNDTTSNRVQISVLIYGINAGIEYVVNVIDRIYTFDSTDKLLNIDDLISFDDINPRITSNNIDNNTKTNNYMTGSNRDTFKLRIIITPINEFCSNSTRNISF